MIHTIEEYGRCNGDQTSVLFSSCTLEEAIRLLLVFSRSYEFVEVGVDSVKVSRKNEDDNLLQTYKFYKGTTREMKELVSLVEELR